MRDDLTDRLLAALSARRDDPVDVAEVDRRLEEALASGRLSEEGLREAFDRAFPPHGPRAVPNDVGW